MAAGTKDAGSASRSLEISAADLKRASLDAAAASAAGAGAFHLRGHAVMLAADVALVFGVETRAVVQNVKANPDLFPERYAFELDPGEVDLLRSAGLIPKPGRGGSRARPWVLTRKGALRLATLMKSERAVRATDVLIDVFDEVLEQVRAGASQVTIAEPARLAPGEAERQTMAVVRDNLAAAMNALFAVVVDQQRNTTLADELHAVSAEAVNHVKAWLRGKTVANEKLEAETMLILEQARDIYERRQADLADGALERERKALENVRLRIAVAGEMMQLYRRLEPGAVATLAGGFSAARPLTLSSPSPSLPSDEV